MCMRMRMCMCARAFVSVCMFLCVCARMCVWLSGIRRAVGRKGHVIDYVKIGFLQVNII